MEWQNQLHYRTLHYRDNIPLGATFSAWNDICVQPDYVLLFDKEDSCYEGSFSVGPGTGPATGKVLITAHDRPLIYTPEIIVTSGTEHDGTIWGDVNQEDGARCSKWTLDKFLTNAMENDFRIFCLVDVYLMKAECLIRTGGNSTGAIRLVNAVRECAYGNSNHNYVSVDPEKIALERKFELAWECHACQDNIRSGVFQNAHWLKSETKGKDYMNIFPTSQDAW